MSQLGETLFAFIMDEHNFGCDGADCQQLVLYAGGEHVCSRVRMLREGTIKRIHVDQRVIRANLKRAPEDAEPPITIQTSKGPLKAQDVEILGPSRLVHRPTEPLSCGARLWIETTAEVRIG